MTIKELISKLEKLPSDSEIKIFIHNQIISYPSKFEIKLPIKNWIEIDLYDK